MSVIYISKIAPMKEYIDVYINGSKLDFCTDTIESDSGLVHIKVIHKNLLAHEEKVVKEIIARYLKGGYEVCKYESVMPPYFCVTEASIMPRDDKVYLEVRLENSKVSLKVDGGQMLDYKSKFDITKRALRRGIIYSLVCSVLTPIILFVCMIGLDFLLGGSNEFWLCLELIIIAGGSFMAWAIQLYYLIRSICIYVKTNPKR